MKYKVYIHDRDYSSWSWIEEETNETISPPSKFSPLTFFSNDIILYDNHTITTIHSLVRSAIHFAGILVLDGNRTYGRNSKNKLLYK